MESPKNKGQLYNFRVRKYSESIYQNELVNKLLPDLRKKSPIKRTANNPRPKSPSSKNDGSSPDKFHRNANRFKTCAGSKLSIPVFGGIIKSSVKLYENYRFKENMEDVPLIVNNFQKLPNKHLFCIFDGHGGDETANLCAKSFANFFIDSLREYPSSIEIALKKTFHKLDEENIKKDFLEIGSTATAVYIHNKILFCANVGDSSCYLVRKDGAVMISYDDKCTDASEVKRIINAGGTVEYDRLAGTLAISRSIGDHDLKDKGLICEPHIYKSLITENDKFIVIASDGVWDVISSDKLYEICIGEKDTDVIVEKIVDEAIEMGSEDNISCIVIALNR